MAEHTSISWRSLVIYEVFVRNHGSRGTFADIEDDLLRIRDLGVDVVWLMPIYPIGQLHRKGSLGSPYSIRDLKEVNSEYGTKEDLRRLVDRAHELKLKVMLDIVFNHSAFDSDLVRDHIDWFHRGIDGGPYRAVQGWTDVVGFKHANSELTAYLIDVLKYWVVFGVDGFRCDVASMLPKQFWLEARRQVNELRRDILWLAESVNARFVVSQRRAGLLALSDCELYEVFDMTYDYDIWSIWQAVVVGKAPINRYLEMLRFQDCIYPANYIKLRCVEHHDSARFMSLVTGRNQGLAWTAFQAFNKGALLIYAGQESAATHTPSLFEIDRIEWGNYELAPFLTKLIRLKKDLAEIEGQFVIVGAEPAVQAAWQHSHHSLYGVFNILGSTGEIDVPLPDGTYEDLLNHAQIEVRKGKMPIPEYAAILRYHQAVELKTLYSDLIDFQVSS